MGLDPVIPTGFYDRRSLEATERVGPVGEQRPQHQRDQQQRRRRRPSEPEAQGITTDEDGTTHVDVLA